MSKGDSRAQKRKADEAFASTNHESGRAPSSSRLQQRAQALQATRKTLPIYHHADEIRAKTKSHDVLLLVGETGSGKSTQIPQFLLHEPYIKPKKGSKGLVGGRIAITQPRRVAAISLARRVAEEIGTTLGDASPASQVGYSVRFDTSVSPGTKIKFVTDGMLLQELLRDPWLKEYSVVVVDEVHERGLNVDLVLGFLKRIIEAQGDEDGRGGVPLKVVVMSATADMEKIEKFFQSRQNGLNGGAEQQENGTNGIHSDNEVPFEGFSDDDTNDTHDTRIVSCFIKGRQFPVQINYTSAPVESAIDAAMDRIIQIHQYTPIPGDILVFLPGQETIDMLESLCKTYSTSLAEQSKQKGAPRIPKILILPLFAALPTTEQQEVFKPTPPFTRKIILSTNIAETSVTVPGIRHVIDTGKRKARFFRPSLNLDTLLTKPISRSSAKQRAGRAGREAPGTCWRLYTEQTFHTLDADTEPEILRCDLAQLVLTLKARDVTDIFSFPLLTAPPLQSLERAMLQLLRLDALDRTSTTGTISPLGRQMSRLPLPAPLARILLASTTPQHNCLPAIIDIVSGLSVENIWLPIHQHQHQARTNTDRVPNPNPDPDSDSDSDESNNPIARARRALQRRSGDHMTLLAAMQGYAAEHSDRKLWCQRHGISHRAMRAAMAARKQLTNIMSSSRHFKFHRPPTGNAAEGDTGSDTDNNTDINTNGASVLSADSEANILHCLLTGLKSNTAYLSPSPSTTPSTANSKSTSSTTTPAVWSPYTTHLTQKPLQIHPSSVLFARAAASRPKCIVFSEFVYTSRPYGRVVSEVEEAWLLE